MRYLFLIFILGCSVCRYEGQQFVEWEKFNMGMPIGNYTKSCVYTKVTPEEYLYDCDYSPINALP